MQSEDIASNQDLRRQRLIGLALIFVTPFGLGLASYAFYPLARHADWYVSYVYAIVPGGIILIGRGVSRRARLGLVYAYTLFLLVAYSLFDKNIFVSPRHIQAVFDDYLQAIVYVSLGISCAALFVCALGLDKFDPDTSFCVKCGYNLFGLTSSRCPECGTEFDLQNRESFRRTPKRPLWKERWAVFLPSLSLFLTFVCLCVYAGANSRDSIIPLMGPLIWFKFRPFELFAAPATFAILGLIYAHPVMPNRLTLVLTPLGFACWFAAPWSLLLLY